MIKRDLFVVVADLDAENAIKTLLCKRQEALGIRVQFEPNRFPLGDLLRFKGRDCGCYKRAVEILRAPQKTHHHALLCFDKHGCGADDKGRDLIEEEVEAALQANGWTHDTVAVVVIDPELEAWVWADSPHVADELGWKDDRLSLRPFLSQQGLWPENALKPLDPKEALNQALRKAGKPGGARLFASLASRVGLDSCQDPAFQKLRQTLLNWFPA